MKGALFSTLVALSLALAAQVGYSADLRSRVTEIHHLLQEQAQQLQTLRAELTEQAQRPPSCTNVARQAQASLSPEQTRVVPPNESPLHFERTSTEMRELNSPTAENIAARLEASRLIEAAVSTGQWTQSDASQLHQLFQNTTTADRRVLIKKLAVAINEGTLKVLVKGRIY